MSKSTPRIVWWILAVGMAARLMVAHWTSGVELILDEVNYLDYGQHLLAHGLLPDAFRPPMYPALIAIAQGLGGEGASSVRVLQSLISIGAGWTLYRWLLEYVGHKGAVLSTALWCFYPVLIGFSHLLWTETLFLSMMIFFFATALPAGEMSIRRTALAGAVYGLTTLTRSVLMPIAWLAPVAVMLHTQRWAWRPQRSMRALVFIGSFALTISPWVAHNKSVEDRWILTETTHGYNLWKGNTSWEHPFATEAPQYPGPVVSIPMFPYEGSGPRINAHCESEHDDAEGPFTRWHLSRCTQEMAINHIVSDPAAFLAHGFSKLGHAFHPSNLLTRHLWLGMYGPLPPMLRLPLIWGTAAAFLGMMLITLLAIKRSPNIPLKAVVAAVALYQLAVIFITFGNSRFRLPILVVGMILAAWIPKRIEPAP
jgi:4-amino-4-deoxy-L-arabinose transferase-like glycosyltransferase